MLVPIFLKYDTKWLALKYLKSSKTVKVSLLRRHRHICEMRLLQAATFLSLPVGLSVGLETPAGCWASPVPSQLHLLGQCRSPGHEGEQLLGQGGPSWIQTPPVTSGPCGCGEPGAAYAWLVWHMVLTVVLSPLTLRADSSWGSPS